MHIDLARARGKFDEAEKLARGLIAIDREATRKALDIDRKSTRLNSSHIQKSRMPSSA